MGEAGSPFCTVTSHWHKLLLIHVCNVQTFTSQIYDQLIDRTISMISTVSTLLDVSLKPDFMSRATLQSAMTLLCSHRQCSKSGLGNLKRIKLF